MSWNCLYEIAMLKTLIFIPWGFYIPLNLIPHDWDAYLLITNVSQEMYDIRLWMKINKNWWFNMQNFLHFIKSERS